MSNSSKQGLISPNKKETLEAGVNPSSRAARKWTFQFLSWGNISYKVVETAVVVKVVMVAGSSCASCRLSPETVPSSASCLDQAISPETKLLFFRLTKIEGCGIELCFVPIVTLF